MCIENEKPRIETFKLLQIHMVILIQNKEQIQYKQHSLKVFKANLT